MFVVRTEQLGKRFRKRWAVKALNLEVQKGDVFGFLGPNGAGKSTTIRMLLSLIRPTEGDIELMGVSLRRNRTTALRNVSGIVEKPDFYLYLSAVRNLEIVGGLYGGVPRRRIEEVLETVGLGNRARDKVKTYSHGMKQRLGIAQALLSDPDFIILDEPTNGLDPHGMKEVRELIRALSRDHGKTILLSSHILYEIEQVANRMAIINKGEMVVQGGVRELLEESGTTLLLRAEPRETVQRVVSSFREVASCSEDDDGFRVGIVPSAVPVLTNALVDAGVQISALIPRRSLEEYFISLTESGERGAHMQL